MSRRRELDYRLSLYEELSGILGAMRSFALAELRHIAQRDLAQQHAATALSDAFHDMSAALPTPEKIEGDIWVLFGSVRGFCASFNEDVLRAWKQGRTACVSTIVVGERLAALMPEDPGLSVVAGAVGVTDAAPAIDRILAAVGAARKKVGEQAGLVICYRDDTVARATRILPFTIEAGQENVALPFTYEPAARVAAGVAEHYLFHLLLSLLLSSLRAENQMRLMQMENALRHIERNSEALVRVRNQLRQEEIVEEVELIFQRRDGP